MISNNESIELFTPRPGLVAQRAMIFVEYGDIPSALLDPAFDSPPADETAMLISDHGRLFELSLVAAYVWERMQGGLSVGDLARDVAQAFDVDEATARQDVLSLICDLEDRGLVRRAS